MGKLQLRKGHLGRVPEWVPETAGLRQNVYLIAWLLDRNKEADGFIRLKREGLITERGGNYILCCLLCQYGANFFPLDSE